MQCKDIPEGPILSFLTQMERPATLHDRDDDVPYENSVARAMPDRLPQNLRRAKMAALIRRGLVSGCACGCRGDFEITPSGRQALASLLPTTAGAMA